ncbi:VOC family protein [Reinekea thalattae]|uniref:VOC family protein n=1 Tax=Reinekea thalattae TaxID=2593301 RepID=UPI00319DA432
MLKPRMSMITLGVTNLERSIEFYKALGFPRRGDHEDVAFFELNGTWLGLYGREALAEDAEVSADGSGYNSFTISHNVPSEAEVAQAIEHAVSIGGKLVKPAQKAFWGGYSGYFSDPDGHLWEVAYNPFTWIGPEDN